MDLAFRQITLFELEILSELAQHASLRALARAKHLDPPHLSKILARAEQKLGVALLKRSSSGYLLTPDGQRVVRFAREMLRTSEAFLAPAVAEPVTIAAPRFVVAHVVAPALGELVEPERERARRFRLLDMAPDEVTTIATAQAADVVLTLGDTSLPQTWSRRTIGRLSWAMYVSADHPLRSQTTPEEVVEYPFVVPAYWNGRGFEAGSDYCPLPWSQRRRGDEASSIATALEIARRSKTQAVFAPDLVLRPFCADGTMRRVEVAGWAPVAKNVTLWVHADRVEHRFAARLERALRSFVHVV